jgi:hypothetical protein
MISPEIEQLWAAYVDSEKIRIRAESVRALERFIDAVVALPAVAWHPWARELAERVVDKKYDLPIRLPLFRAVIFPALRAGLDGSMPGCARWLAGLANLLYKSPACQEQLPQDLQSEWGLLVRAIRDDPTDLRAKKRLLQEMRYHCDYAVHEVPSGVLYGNHSASIAECDELLADLDAYEKLAQELGPEEEDLELIEEARFHIPAYRDYLSQPGRYQNYAAYLEAHGRL